MKFDKNGGVSVFDGGDWHYISGYTIAMLQYAADDWSRLEIANEFEISIRTVEAHFDKVRKIFGKKSFAATLAELYRQKIIK